MKRSAARGFIFGQLSGVILTLMVAGLGPSQTARAEGGRDFSATYDVRDVSTIDPTHVFLTLVLRLQNHSGAAVSDAKIVLRDGLPRSKSLGSFVQRLTAANKAVVKISGTFTVPAREFLTWTRGQGPRLEVQLVDSHGRTLRRAVEAIRMPGLGV
jgi:hypothetical protein